MKKNLLKKSKILPSLILLLIVSNIFSQDIDPKLDANTFHDIETIIYNDTPNDISAITQSNKELNEQSWDQSFDMRGYNPEFTIVSINTAAIAAPIVAPGNMPLTADQWRNYVRNQVPTGEAGLLDADPNKGHLLQTNENFPTNPEATNLSGTPDPNINWSTAAHGLEALEVNGTHLVIHGINGHGLSLLHPNGKQIAIEVDWFNDGSYYADMAKTVMASGPTSGYRTILATNINTNPEDIDADGNIPFTLVVDGVNYNAKVPATELLNAGNESHQQLANYLIAHPERVIKKPLTAEQIPHAPNLSFNGTIMSVAGDNYNIVHNGIAADYVFYVVKKDDVNNWQSLNSKEGIRISSTLDVSTLGLTASDFEENGDYVVKVLMIDGDALSEGGTTLSIHTNEITKFIVYPNPTKNTIYFQSNIIIKNIVITDLQGRRIIEKSISNNLNIDLTNLEKGIYFINLYDANNKLRKTKKIIKE